MNYKNVENILSCFFRQWSLTTEWWIITGSWRKARMCVNSVNMRIIWNLLTDKHVYVRLCCLSRASRYITHITYSWLFLSARKLVRLDSTELLIWVSLLQTSTNKKSGSMCTFMHMFQSACDRFTNISSAVSLISYIYGCRERERWSADSL